MLPAEEQLTQLKNSDIWLSLDHRKPQDTFISAGFLRRFLSERVVASQGANAQVWTFTLRHAQILDSFDLSSIGAAGLGLPHIRFEHCTFDGSINLDAAVGRSLSFERCLFLADHFSALGMRLSNHLSIHSSLFSPSTSLVLDQCVIGNSCTLSDLRSVIDETKIYERKRLIAELRDFPYELPEISQSDYFEHCPVESFDEEICIGGLRLLSCNDTRIDGDFTLEGVDITAKPNRDLGDWLPDVPHPSQYAANLRGLRVAGSLNIRRLTERSMNLSGLVSLYYAKIDGDLNILGVRLMAVDNLAALSAEGADIRGYLAIDKHHGHVPVIVGRVEMMAARIGLQLLIHHAEIGDGGGTALLAEAISVMSDFFIINSTFSGTLNCKAASLGGQFVLKGAEITAGGDDHVALDASDITAKGGAYFVNLDDKLTKIVGQISLSNGTFDGKLEFYGIDARPFPGRDYVMRADNIRLRGDLLFSVRSRNQKLPGTSDHCSFLGTVRMAGAHITGRVRFTGEVQFSGRALGSAFIGSGLRAGGGIECEPMPLESCGPTFDGCLRVNRAHLGSQCLFRRTMFRSSELAIEMTHTDFLGDLILDGCSTNGELRLYGAKIRGMLTVQGGSMTYGSTGFCLDAYNAEIVRGVGLYRPREDNEVGLPAALLLRGIVGFAYSRLGNIEFGSFGLVDDGTNRVHNQHGDDALVIEGSVRMTGAKVAYITSLRRVRFAPPCTLGENAYLDIMKTLRKWRVDDDRIILDAEHADLGQQLDICLQRPTSRGLVRLSEASVKEVHDSGGSGWGEEPTGEGWRGNECPDQTDLRGVALQLNGFTYSEIDSEASAKHEETWSETVRAVGLLHYLKWGDRRLPRLRWLHRQFPNNLYRGFQPQPFTQLANVLRKNGHHDAANDAVRERRRLQGTQHATRSERFLLSLFGVLFGYGYSILRASLTLSVLVVLSGIVVHIQSSNLNTLRRVAVIGDTPKMTDPPCDQLPEHTLNQVLPIIHLQYGGGCDLIPNAGLISRASSVFIELLSWILVPTAALTLSGVLRESSAKD